MLISSVNFKGGQGKSLWTAILAAWLGKDAGVLDLDPKQGDAHAWAQKNGRPSSLVWSKDLKVALQGAAKSPDWYVADCPPHEGEETRLALQLSSIVVIPVVPAGAQDARAWGRMQDAIKDAKVVNPGLKVAAVLNASRQTALSKEFVTMLQEWHAPREGRAVLGVVPQRVALSEAFGAGTAPKDEAVAQVLSKLKRFAAE